MFVSSKMKGSNKMKNKINKILVLILAVAMCFCVATGCTNGESAYEIAVKYGFVGTEEEWLESLKGSSTADNDRPSQSIGDVTINNSDSGNIEYAANKGLLSSVSVYTTFKKTITSGGFFGRPGTTSEYEYYSAGSGVIYKLDKENGNAYIVTNYHVVYDADCNTTNHISDNVVIFLYGMDMNKYSIPATYIGGSMTYDIAVLKVENSELLKSAAVAAVEVADSDEINVGQYAIAIGNPEAYGISVTKGIVSLDSEQIEMTMLDNSGTFNIRVIRIDTAVNSGNSGGGLFNDEGKLIGIVNAKMADTSVEGIGYAIPSNVAKAIADNIIYYCDGTDVENVLRPILGITVSIYDKWAVYNGDIGLFEKMETIRVESVEEGSLSVGYFEVGDIIKSITLKDVTKNVTRQHIVIDLMLGARAGDVVTFVVERNGEEITLNITVTEDCLTAY